MNIFSLNIGCVFIILFVSTIAADENCVVSDDEFEKINHILTHIDEPIYSENNDDSEVSDSDACAPVLKSIHLQLRRLTQRYKLMNKGYVKEEEFQKMVKDYDEKLLQLNNALEEFKKDSESSVQQKIEVLMQSVKVLEHNVTTLHQNLEKINEKYGSVLKDLCFTYLEANQISKAKDKIGDLESKYLIELVEQFLQKRNGSLSPVVDFSAAIPDLDDRGQAYKIIYEFLHENNRIEGEDSIWLESEIQRMNSILTVQAKITEERRTEIKELLDKLSVHSKRILDLWILDLNSTDTNVIFKNALDRMFLMQMEDLGDQINTANNYYNERQLLNLLVLSVNYYKIGAYKKIIEKEIGHALAVIMIDIASMEKTELKYDPHIPKRIEEMYDETLNSLPGSLKKIQSCLDRVKIYNHDTNQCIVATEERVDVKHPRTGKVLGEFKRVKTAPSGCSQFRLKLSNSFVSIVTAGGNALTNINSAVPGSTWLSQVGAPYNNKYGMQLDSSRDWILVANFQNDTFRIQSEFNAYQTKTSVDHLIVEDIGGDAQIVVARYGIPGLNGLKGKHTRVEWRIECA